MTRAFLRLAPATAIAAFLASPAFAQDAKIEGADTAWMIGATGLVLMMTIPGLALFYAGMVRKKNALATMAQSLARRFWFPSCGRSWVTASHSPATARPSGRSTEFFSKEWGWTTSHPWQRPFPKAFS
jgi:ammonia channel protein AmtB